VAVESTGDNFGLEDLYRDLKYYIDNFYEFICEEFA
jgi:hypothetical protein